MKKIITITIFLILVVLDKNVAQENTNRHKAKKIRYTSFYLIYARNGAFFGPDIFHKQPTFRVNGTKFIYTFELNTSSPGIKKQTPDTICAGLFRISSIDSIIELVKGFKGMKIKKMNPCLLDGYSYYMKIINGKDSIIYELTNTFDLTFIKVIGIINKYLPYDKQIWTSEEEIKKTDECYKQIEERIKNLNKKRVDSAKN